MIKASYELDPNLQSQISAGRLSGVSMANRSSSAVHIEGQMRKLLLRRNAARNDIIPAVASSVREYTRDIAATFKGEGILPEFFSGSKGFWAIGETTSSEWTTVWKPDEGALQEGGLVESEIDNAGLQIDDVGNIYKWGTSWHILGRAALDHEVAPIIAQPGDVDDAAILTMTNYHREIWSRWADAVAERQVELRNFTSI